MTVDPARTILDLLAAAGHGAHTAAVAALIQPALRIHATAAARRSSSLRRTAEDAPHDAAALDALVQALAALPPGASRFGGIPDLPPGVDWPARDGVPMEFIAQLRLADVAAAWTDGRLPAQGSLLFFYNSQWTTSEQDASARCCAVLFHAGPDEALVRAPPPFVEWTCEPGTVSQVAPLIHGLATLRFEPAARLPCDASPFVTPPLAAFWEAFHDDVAQRSRAPAPFHENFLLGYVDERDHIDAHEHGTADQLLLQVDSEDAAQLEFGDCNKLYFLIHQDDLAARVFERVRVYAGLG